MQTKPGMRPSISFARRCGYSTAPSLLIREQRAIASGPHTECSLTVKGYVHRLAWCLKTANTWRNRRSYR